MYGMPQPNTYGQFPGYGGYAGAPGTASPGMPQAAPGAPGGAGLGLGAVGQQGAADPNAAAAGQAQGQWPAGDPNSYYSNYWGGKFLPLLTSPPSLMIYWRRILRTAASWPTGCSRRTAPRCCLICMNSVFFFRDIILSPLPSAMV